MGCPPGKSVVIRTLGEADSRKGNPEIGYNEPRLFIHIGEAGETSCLKALIRQKSAACTALFG
jgi:hypothetical protein